MMATNKEKSTKLLVEPPQSLTFTVEQIALLNEVLNEKEYALKYLMKQGYYHRRAIEAWDEALERLTSKIQNNAFKSKSDIKTYFCSIARHTAADHRKAHKRAKKNDAKIEYVPDYDAVEASIYNGQIEPDEIQTIEIDTQYTTLSCKTLTSRFWKSATDEIAKPLYLQIFQLSFIENLTDKDVARRLDITDSNMRISKMRMLKAFRENETLMRDLVEMKEHLDISTF